MPVFVYHPEVSLWIAYISISYRILVVYEHIGAILPENRGTDVLFLLDSTYVIRFIYTGRKFDVLIEFQHFTNIFLREAPGQTFSSCPLLRITIYNLSSLKLFHTSQKYSLTFALISPLTGQHTLTLFSKQTSNPFCISEVIS